MKGLGAFLVEDGALTLPQLEVALAKQRELSDAGTPKRIGEVLLELRLVTPEQLQSALERQQLERS